MSDVPLDDTDLTAGEDDGTDVTPETPEVETPDTETDEPRTPEEQARWEANKARVDEIHARNEQRQSERKGGKG